MFEYFFTSRENLPSNLGFSFYDSYHLSWLFFIILFIIMISGKYKSLSTKKRDIFKKILGSCILGTEIIFDFILIITHQFNVNYLPFHLCGIAILLCFYDVFFPNDIVREFLFCSCMPGAVSALLFPNWADFPILNFSSIDSFIVHSLLVCYPIMLVHSNEFFPDYKRLPTCLLLLFSIAFPIYFFNKIFNTNFLFINTPSEGSPLVVLENWLGNPGYILGMLVMVLLCWLILYIPVIIKKIYISKRNIYKELT